MVCPVCGVAGEIQEGRCMKCGAAAPAKTGRLCPQCNAPVSLGEAFCASCGRRLVPDRAKEQHAYQKRVHDLSVKTGRVWILVVSGMALFWGLIQFGLGRSEVEKQIQQAEAQFSHLDPADRDAHFKQATGMTWQQAVDHDRGQVRLLLAVNLALAIAYFGLWTWAARNAFAAALIALLLSVTVAVISAIVDPKTIVQGILIKILFIAALLKSVSAAYASRKLAESGA